MNYLQQLFSQYWLAMLLSAALAYILGSVNFAIIITTIVRKRDIRKYGSGNAGATNVMRTFGPELGVCTFICDVLKGVGAAWFAFLIAGALVPGGSGAWETAYIGALFGVLGHMYPVFFDFKGGKGVSTALGALLFLDWRIGLSCLGVFIIAVACTRMVSLGSVLAAVSVPAAAFLYNNFVLGSSMQLTIFATVITFVLITFVVIKHRKNIKRIFNGTESKLSFGKKKSKISN